MQTATQFDRKIIQAGIAASVVVGLALAPVSVAHGDGGSPGQGTASAGGGVVPALLKEFRPIGASGNNLANPAFNPVPGSAELAIVPPNSTPLSAGMLTNGPNPRTISNVVSGATSASGQNAQTTDPIASAWLYVFGQFVDHDLDLEDTPPTNPSINIVVPKGDPAFPDGSAILMNRATVSPTTKTAINTVAGFLDLSQLYGSTADVAASLRNPDGTLQSSSNGQALPIQNGVFVTGDARVMENPELVDVTTLFMREHNYWVGRLRTAHPDWTGDQLYQMARAITTAEYEKIVYTEYLPLLVGPAVGLYQGYRSDVNPQVTQEFSTAAFRVGHSQISGTQEGLDNNGNVTFTESLSQAFFNTPAQDEANDGINSQLRAISADSSQATDVYAVNELRNLLFAPLVGGDVDKIDLIAIDIQRERDLGLGTLNQTRQKLGLAPYGSFAQLTRDPTVQANLRTVFGSIDNVDLFMGGLAENHAPLAIVGPTFQRIIADQFRALRDGDRFFWLNQGFDPATVGMIALTTLGDIIKRDSNTVSLQPLVFLAPRPR